VFVAPLYLFPQLKSSPITFYVFLPAGVKLFAILIFRWRGLVGSALGTFSRLSFTDPAHPIISWLIVAAAANLAIYGIVSFGLRLMGVKKDLSNLKYYQIVLMATAASIANGFIFAHFVQLLKVGQMSNDLFHSEFMVIIGNFAGNAVFVCLAVLMMQKKQTIINFTSKLKK